MSTIKLFVQRRCFLLTCSLVAGCAVSKDSERTKPSTRFDANKSLFGTIRNADRVTLYEGLPHQDYEGEQLAEEKRKNATVTLHGFPFYRERLDLKGSDTEKLKDLLGDERSFAEGAGGGTCGTFHPDYCVVWGSDTEVYRFLICFTCGEAMVYGPNGSLYCRIRLEACKGVRQLLAKYEKNRPPRGPDLLRGCH